MKCPRCNSHMRYGQKQCKKCGLHFRYSENAESWRLRSTATIFARIGGVFGLHDFYLGFYLIGVVRAVLFLCMCGLFFVPQVINICTTGMFRVTPDFVGIAGSIFLVLTVISYVLALIESMRIAQGISNKDVHGFFLR